MNYIYDILLNLNKDVYDFYDWNQEDEVMHVKKAPIFYVDSEVIDDLTCSEIIMNNTFLDKIYKKTEIFTERVVKNINHLAVFSDGSNAIAVKFTKDGKNKLKSKFLIDEDIEINNLAIHLPKTNVDYQIKQANTISNTTRFKKEAMLFLKNKLTNLNDPIQIRYLNYELFSIKTDSKDELIKNLSRDFDKYYLKIYDFFKLIGIKK